ncbi:two-component system chemotaxis response regulator CheY [Rhodopirellula rubra]|uniref:Two-component system chemotaxis response regulator CheY n=1 Tax=Aporhodopirellula rubra TaxID=980271 RepID=A0A7W5DVB5_9BACT|nr:response regulator [Aporhodopirellula rubra]MBB3204859.1 two-component system chemotaxis response regulator CheY [Aporhodopirellula rubra]
MKVLLAEDSGVMRKIIMRGLHSLWVEEVVEAADGAIALDLFEKHGDFNLVLTDWNMPNMTGLELVKAIRATGSKVPIMMITTEAEKARVVEAIQAGINDYLVKPFDQPMLQEKLDRVLPKAKS